jgi:predicted tellurium resistance membrane protein TerC
MISMRYMAAKMSRLMNIYPYLENRAYMVIFLIGLKLAFSGVLHFTGWESVKHVVDAEWFDMVFSTLSMALFLPLGVKKHEYVNPNTELSPEEAAKL